MAQDGDPDSDGQRGHGKDRQRIVDRAKRGDDLRQIAHQERDEDECGGVGEPLQLLPSHSVRGAEPSEQRRTAEDNDREKQQLEDSIGGAEYVGVRLESERIPDRGVPGAGICCRRHHRREHRDSHDRRRSGGRRSPASRRQMTVGEQEREEESEDRDRRYLGPESEPCRRVPEWEGPRHDDQGVDRVFAGEE